MVRAHTYRVFSLFFAAVLFFVFKTDADAQQVFGSIIGTITDPSGSAVSNAKITIADVNKGTSFDTTTNESGNYTKGQLIPGVYRVTVEATGFSKVVSSDITVVTDQAARFDASMPVGNVEQQIEVTAAAPLLQTDRADVAQTFTSKTISELPSIGRNLQAFELLNPGTVKMQWQHASSEDPQGSVQAIVNGQLFDSTGYYLDGTINQDPILGIIVINPTFDSVNEVKQANQDYDAEFGYTGAGLLTYSTKSGTNEVHGSAFEFIFLNTPGFQDFGRNPFSENTPLGQPGVYTPTTHQNQFGGSIGGRIIKDKLFFFGDAQLTRNRKGGSVLTGVPTAANRTGDLSDWLRQSTNYPACLSSPQGCSFQLYDPLTGNPDGTGRTRFVNNIIPASRLSPQALNILNYFPLPNTAQSGVGVPYNNFAANGTLRFDADQWDTRWDYYVNEKNSVFGRYSYGKYYQQAPGAFGLIAGGPAFNTATYAGISNTLNQSISGGWTHTVNPTLINEFRYGYMRYHVETKPNGFGTQPATQAGIPGLNLDTTFTSGMPYFEIDNNPAQGSQNYSLGYALTVNSCNCPLTQIEQQHQFVDNINKIVGNHNFKFGADIRYATNLRVPSDRHRAGQLYFNNSVTGFFSAPQVNPFGGVGLATFLLGDTTNFQRYVSSSTNARERQKRLFWYAQDSWRVTPKLTFTYGLRWEWVFPETVNAPGNGAELNVNNGTMNVFGIGLISSSGYQSANWKLFAPRVSLAYQLGSKTVVRAGYGWTYSLGTFGSTFGHNVTQNPPVLAFQTISQTSACGNNLCDVFTLGRSGNGLSIGPKPYVFPIVSPDGTFMPAGTGANAATLKTRPGIMTMPTFYLYNFTVQRQITNKISVSGGYVGNQGRHTPLGPEMEFNMNNIIFVPGFTGNTQSLAPFNGVLGPRYNYGWTQIIQNYCNCANNRYDSFQGIVNVNGVGGFTLSGNYTYQLAQGDGWPSQGQDNQKNDYSFLYNRKLQYGRNDFMPSQQWVLSSTYEIPFGKGRKFGANSSKWVDAILGGWNLSGIYTFYSGIPFMPHIENYGPNVQPYTGPNDRPDVGTGSPYASNKNRSQWIVPIAAATGPYRFPASNTFGNYSINSLIGPWFNNLDASVMKQFTITERVRFTLRMDTTNTLNHANLGNPNNDVQSATAGQITSLAFGNNYLMRRVQYAGIFRF
jgi:hypothetical protein